MGIFDTLDGPVYRAIAADPPWAFKPYAPPAPDAEGRRDVEQHYNTMSLADIKALPVASLCHPEGCHLFLWATGPMLPQAFDVMAAWGFKFSGVGFTWIKLKKSFKPNQLRFLPLIGGDFHTGLGFTTRKNAEFCLLGRRSSPKREAKNIRELIIAPRREHSRKPDEARERIEKYCKGPYLEMFARERREGWSSWGNEVGKFND